MLYEGPSVLDGKPIVLVATLQTNNAKTGDLIQTWILRSDIDPLTALATGDDESICGNCKDRGKNGKGRSCYVNVHQAPLNIFRTYLAGNYLRKDYNRLGQLTWLLGRKLRCGSYGDPAAVPIEIWQTLIPLAEGWTGYTHQWKTCDQDFKDFCMASVDSEEEYHEAKKMGWRTFRVRRITEELLDSEFSCPASEEMGNRRTCETCLACSGTRFGNMGSKAADVNIIVHGSKPKISSWNKPVELTVEV